MKPKRTQTNIAPRWQGVTAGYKTTSSQAKPTSLVSTGAPVKPFAGKVFYLDLPSNRISDTLESDIKELGGTVEKFFSKEIKYLVSNKLEARYMRSLGRESPVPSQNCGQSSPHPQSKSDRSGNNGDNVNSRILGQSETFVTSRGKTLVERVVKEQGMIPMNKILSNALEWGVKVLYVDDVIAYVKKKKTVLATRNPSTTAVKVKAEPLAKIGLQKCKGGRITKPFIKVEDSSRQYRPIYLTMPNILRFNLKTIPPCSPFFVDDKDPPGNKQRGHRGVKASVSEERAHGRKNKDKKRGGYCECCMIKYENVMTHLKSACHKAFSKSDEYFVIDKLVSAMHCNFIQIRTQVKSRCKCSVSSVLIVPGPCGKPDQGRKLGSDSTENIREQQRYAVERLQGCYSGHTSVPLILREGDTRSNDTHSNRSRKWPCRQTPLSSCVPKAPQAKMETASSRCKSFGSIPSRDTQISPVDQVLTEDMSSPTSHFHNTNMQNEVPSKSLSVKTNQQEEPDTKHDSSMYESAQDGNIFQDIISGNDLSEMEEGSLPVHSVSPFRKIQRKIKAYKWKRRKVDMYVKHVKPSDIPDSSKLKLWELFQSSDDMDVEFLGFED